uniref:Uncharacterized protein n=1 Tax=Oryza brachyantha TaxID=4533 RepID=J3MSP9_ORYBR
MYEARVHGHGGRGGLNGGGQTPAQGSSCARVRSAQVVVVVLLLLLLLPTDQRRRKEEEGFFGS